MSTLLQSPLPPPASRSFPQLSYSTTAGIRLPRRRRFCIALRSVGGGGDRWKLTDIDLDVVQESVRSWLRKARTVLTEVALPLVTPGQGQKPAIAREIEDMAVQEELFVASDVTVDRRTPNGYLSLSAVISIEQFGRISGLTGKKMQMIFEALAPEAFRNSVRSLVEYCCIRYLARENSDFHPKLKDLEFQRLVFVTMLAWEQPYEEDSESESFQDSSSFQGQVVHEEAFVRIAPAAAGVADVSTAHHLFKALVGEEPGISLGLWMAYLSELLKANAQQPKLFVGMILILIFAEALALYGLIVGIILSSQAGQSRAD